MDHRIVYRCIHCAGIANIQIIKHTEKGTVPEIEFCPFCGLTNMYPLEFKTRTSLDRVWDKDYLKEKE